MECQFIFIKIVLRWWEGDDLCSGLHGADWPKPLHLHWENIWGQGIKKSYIQFVLFVGKQVLLIHWPKSCAFALRNPSMAKCRETTVSSNLYVLFVDWPKNVHQSPILLGLTIPNMYLTPAQTKHLMYGNVGVIFIRTFFTQQIS